MKNSIKLITLTCVSALISACGGGGGGGGGSASPDVFQNLTNSVFTGNSFIVGPQLNDTASNVDVGCYNLNAFQSRSTTESNLASQGGTVTKSTATTWCGSSSTQSVCLTQIEKGFVIDGQNLGNKSIKLFMPGLVSGKMTFINYNTQISPSASLLSNESNPSCSGTPQASTHLDSAINGTWQGYKITYSPTSNAGTSSSATISCTLQNCITSDAPSIIVPMVRNLGVSWISSPGASRFAAASLSNDESLLSFALCSKPLTESITFESCSFYSLKR